MYNATLSGRVEDAHSIGVIRREDDLAACIRSCTRELEIAAQLRGNADGLETLIGKIEDAHTMLEN